MRTRREIQAHLVEVADARERADRDVRMAVIEARLSGVTDDWIAGIIGVSSGRVVTYRYGPRHHAPGPQIPCASGDLLPTTRKGHMRADDEPRQKSHHQPDQPPGEPPQAEVLPAQRRQLRPSSSPASIPAPREARRDDTGRGSTPASRHPARST